jgi:hypothetical protein
MICFNDFPAWLVAVKLLELPDELVSAVVLFLSAYASAS